MTTTKTADGALSQYLKDVRGRLKRDKDERELPQTVFARALGEDGRHPSSINRIEQGDVRPSDDFLAEIAEAYPNAADLKKMLDLRERQFGTEEEWSEKRKRLRAKARAAKASRAASEADKRGAKKAKAPAATPPTKGEASTATPPAKKPPPAPPAPATLRQQLTRHSGVTTPFGVRAPATTPAAEEAPRPEAPQSAARSASEERETEPQTPGVHAALLAEMLPMFQSLSATLSPAAGMRMVAAGAIVADRLRQLYRNADPFSAMDMKAAARSFAVDLYSVLAGELSLEPDAIDEERTALRAVLGHSPEREVVAEDVGAVLRETLVPVVGDGTLMDVVDLLVLRTLALGARR